MRKLLIPVILLLLSLPSFAQTIIQKDPMIEKMVAEVSVDTLKSYINKLVSFGTRSTLSTTTTGSGPTKDLAMWFR